MSKTTKYYSSILQNTTIYLEILRNITYIRTTTTMIVSEMKKKRNNNKEKTEIIITKVTFRVADRFFFIIFKETFPFLFDIWLLLFQIGMTYIDFCSL